MMKLSLGGHIGFLQVKEMERKDNLGSEEVSKDSEKVLGASAEMPTEAGKYCPPRPDGDGLGIVK